MFYNEFFKRTSLSGKELGIVLTPEHVKEFMCELININKNDIVLDTCTGTGGFLITAMHRMLKQAETEKEVNDIKFIRGDAVAQSYYDQMVKVFNKRDEDDPDRKKFFSVLKVNLDKQKRLPLTAYLTTLVGFNVGGVHYFFGYGNYFDIYRLKDISSLVEEETAKLILEHEQSK